MIGLTVQNSVDIFEHSLKVFVCHQLSLILRRQLLCFFHQTTQESSLLFFYLLLLLLYLHLQLGISHISLIALLRTFLPFARIMSSFGIWSHFVNISSWNLSHSSTSLRISCFLRPILLIIFILENILSSSRYLISWMNIDCLFFQRKRTKRINKKMAKLLINIFLDIFS